MSKFCTNCGTPLAEDARFCAGCGTPVVAAPAPQPAPAPAPEPVPAPIPAPEPAPVPIPEPVPAPAPEPVPVPAPEPVYAPQPEPVQQPVYAPPAYNYQNAPVPAPKKKGKGGLIGVIVAIIAALAVAAIFVPWGDLFSGGSKEAKDADSYESAVQLMVDVVLTGKSDNVEDMAPKSLWDWIEETEDVTVADVKDTLEEVFEDMDDYYSDEYGDDYKITFEITDKEEASKEEITSIQNAIEAWYTDDIGEVEKAYFLEVELTIEGSEDNDTDDEELTVIQIDGKWYPVYFEFDEENGNYISFYAEDLIYY